MTSLIGEAGDDAWLDGGAGNDKMKGGAGNDTYVISDAGDTIDEEGNADSGRCRASLIGLGESCDVWRLGAIEHVDLLGTDAIKATGNDARQRS